MSAASDTWRAVARALVGEPELTGIEVATQAGIDFEQARRLWRALGFPPVADDERVFTRSDVTVLQAIRALIEAGHSDEHGFVQLTRATGQSLARLAEALVAAGTERVGAIRAASASETAAADAIASMITSLVPRLEPLLTYVWRRHLLAAVLRAAATGDDHSAASRTLAIGFADLVGFTAISQTLTEHELATMVDRFEALAYEHIPHRGGRVVKMIGDEVMFSVDDALAAAEIALALVEAGTDSSTLPEVRAGVAIGPTLSWEGDLFGPTVNLASRLVNIARPGTVLLSQELGALLEGKPQFALRHLRPLPLKGIGRVRVWVLRRTGAELRNPPAMRRRRGRERKDKERQHA